MTHAAALPPEILRVFETVPDLYLILSPDFSILTASDAYLAATFKNREEIIGRCSFEIFPDNPALHDSKATSSFKHSLEWVLKHKQPHQMGLLRYDVTNHFASGSFEEKYWLSSNTPVLNDEGNVQYIIHKTEDVTGQIITQKRVEDTKQQVEKLNRQQIKINAELLATRAEAERQREQLYNIMMQAPAMICIFEGPQHIFKLVNPPYQQLVGDRPLLGKPIAEAMPELAGQPIFRLLDEVYHTGKSFYAQEMKVQLDHDNTGGLGHNYYNFTYQATRNLEGKIDGILVFAYEVTAHVEARQKVEQREKALHELNRQLATANRELSRTQQALQDLNQELEERVADKTKKLRQAQAKVKAERNRLHQLFMEAPAPICILDGEQFVYELINPAYQQIFPGRELYKKPLLKALPELKDSPVPEILKHVYQTGETFISKELSLMLARYQGAPMEEIIWNFTYQARRDDQGQIDGILVYAFEVTDEVKARHTVEQSANRLQLITDALPVLIGYLDKEEKYRFANKAYEAWFPLKSKDLLGRTVREVVGEKAYQGVKQYIDRALAGERLDFESKMPYREDFIKYIRTSYVPDIQDGTVEGFYTLVHDITEQIETWQKIEEREKEALALTKKLATTNEELTATNEQLSRTNVDLDNFIYTASHDLKAPIFNIEGLMKILVNSIPEQVLVSQDLEGVTSRIEDSIARFKRTIDHLTDVTKLQKENNQEAVQINLSQVVEEVRLDLSPQLEAAEAHLEINVTSCPGIRFSEKNLRSVVYNLLSNSIKYRSPERKLHIQIHCKPAGEYVALSVQDNGLGINLPSKNTKLFTMFNRMHDHVEGSGIGLYMVKKIVENAGGHIEVESHVDVGSVFTVYFKS